MGFSAVAIADRVGHESIEITYRYAHLFPSKQKEMAVKLDFMKSAALLKCPALILCGANDKANLKSALRFHEAIKNSELAIIKEAGHEVNIDKPIELADVLGAFWKQHSGLSL